MIRSRLLFLILLLAYLGMTPAGVYTCACLIPSQAALEQASFDAYVEDVPLTNTATDIMLGFMALSFILFGGLYLAANFNISQRLLYVCQEPHEFKHPPPTPPPHFI